MSRHAHSLSQPIALLSEDGAHASNSTKSEVSTFFRSAGNADQNETNGRTDRGRAPFRSARPLEGGTYKRDCRLACKSACINGVVWRNDVRRLTERRVRRYSRTDAFSSTISGRHH